MFGEDLADEFSTAAQAYLVEDGLEVISNRVGRDVEFVGDFGRGEPAQDEPRYLALPLCQAVRLDDQRCDLRGPRLLEDDGYLSLGDCGP